MNRTKFDWRDNAIRIVRERFEGLSEVTLQQALVMAITKSNTKEEAIGALEAAYGNDKATEKHKRAIKIVLAVLKT